MNKLKFKVDINAPVDKVYDTMLGLGDKSDSEMMHGLFLN